MFEDSLMESQNRLSSPNQRWTTILSLNLQCFVAGAIVALPLLHPETLPFHLDAPTIMLPLRPAALPIPQVEAENAASTSAITPALGHPFIGPRLIPNTISNTFDAPPTTSLIGNGMSDPNGSFSMLADAPSGNGPRISISPADRAPKGILHVSTGVSTGLLLAPIVPVYPRIAVAAHIQGTVKVEAIISKAGHVESARAVSGPEMLRQAALGAIRNARYTPFLLNGAPTEVETTITVNFKLSN